MLFVAVKDITLLSNDLINWFSSTSSIFHEELDSVASGKGVYVASAFGHKKSYISNDAVNWTEIIDLSGADIYQVRFINNMFFAVGWKNNGIEDHVSIWKSIDGFSWTDISPAVGTTTIPGACKDISYNSGIYVVPSGNGIYYSADLLSWTLVPKAYDCRVATTDGTIFVVGGVGSFCWSTNGAAWTDSSFPAGYNPVRGNTVISIIYEFGQFIACAERDIFTSPDGLVWLNSYESAFNIDNVTSAKDLNKIVGFGQGPAGPPACQIITSPDGITWSPETIVYYGSAGMNDACIYSTTYEPTTKAAHSAIPIIASIGSIEAIKDSSKTGFAALEQSYATAIIDRKLPSMISAYEACLRKAHSTLFIICAAAGITTPAAFPIISPFIYTAILQFQSILFNIETLDLSSLPTPTDQHQLDNLSALSEQLSNSLSAAHSLDLRISSIFDMYSISL